MAAEHTALQESILLLPKRGAVQAGDDSEATLDAPPETLEEAKKMFSAAYSAMGIVLPRDLLPSDSESDDEVGEGDGVTETDAVAPSGTDGAQTTPTDNGSSTSIIKTPTPPASVPNAGSISTASSKSDDAGSVEKGLHANGAHSSSPKPVAASCGVTGVADAGLTKGQRKRRNKKNKAAAAAAGNGAEAKPDITTQGQAVPDRAARAVDATTTAHAPVKTSKPMTFAERWAAARAAKTAFEAAAGETQKTNMEVDDASRPSAHLTDTGDSGLILPVEAGYIETQEDDELAVIEADASLEDGPTAKKAHITAADVDNYLRPKLELPAPRPNRKAELSAPKDKGDSTNIEKFKERYYGLKFGRSSEDAEFVSDVCYNYVKGEESEEWELKKLKWNKF